MSISSRPDCYKDEKGKTDQSSGVSPALLLPPRFRHTREITGWKTVVINNQSSSKYFLVVIFQHKAQNSLTIAFQSRAFLEIQKQIGFWNS